MTFVEVVSPIEDIIEDARNGRMFILVDDEGRENEGDIVIPAQMATPAAINLVPSAELATADSVVISGSANRHDPK